MALQPDLASAHPASTESRGQKKRVVPEDLRAFQSVSERVAALYEFELLHATTLAEVEQARRERRGALMPRSVTRNGIAHLWQEVAQRSPQLTDSVTGLMKALGIVYRLEDDPNYKIVGNNWTADGKTIHAATRVDRQKISSALFKGDVITKQLSRDLLTYRAATTNLQDFQGTYAQLQQHMRANLEEMPRIVSETVRLRDEIGNAHSVSGIVRNALTGEIVIPRMPQIYAQHSRAH